ARWSPTCPYHERAPPPDPSRLPPGPRFAPGRPVPTSCSCAAAVLSDRPKPRKSIVTQACPAKCGSTARKSNELDGKPCSRRTVGASPGPNRTNTFPMSVCTQRPPSRQSRTLGDVTLRAYHRGREQRRVMNVDFAPDPRLYPFESRWFDSSRGRIHYIDEGS